MSLREEVYIVADWDADGAVAAATLVYSQRYRGKYPVEGKVSVEAIPSEPKYLEELLGRLDCYLALVIIDIPLLAGILEGLKAYRERCSDTKIIYIDHHITTHEMISELSQVITEPLIGYVPSSKIAFDRVSLLMDVKNSRLEQFVRAAYYMDQGLKIPKDLLSIARLLSRISKAMNYSKDENLWRSIVGWISSPVPLAPFDLDKKLRELAKRSDEMESRIKQAANELAISAVKVGFFKLIDARKRWRRKGATALASKIYRIINTPLILVVSTRSGDEILLIIKYPRKAYRVARLLKESGIAINIGGHPSISVVRLSSENYGRAIEMIRAINISKI